MSRKIDVIGELVAESRELEELGRRVQGERRLAASDDEISALVERYHAWLARALDVLPAEYEERFRTEYSGSWHSHKIKHFFQAPGEVSLFHRTDNDTEAASPFPFWQYPFDTTFRGPLLAQRQILTEAQQLLSARTHSEDVEMVVRICRGFNDFLEPLARRQQQREPIAVNDEYDVQDLLHGLLRIFFEDVRPEDYVPERAGARSRLDFLLKPEKIVVEAKMARTGHGAARIGDELIVDIERYRGHPDCEALVALIYDPSRVIRNRRGLEADLSGERDGLVVRIVVQ